MINPVATIRAMAILALLTSISFGSPASAQESIVVASTSSTEQSGLFDFLLPYFRARTGIGVKVIAAGTGQALDIGRRGDADVVFVHDRPAEEKFVSDGFGVRRFDVMYNDFVLIGPKSDPAHVSRSDNILDAFSRIAAEHATFISRGDRSGTHAAELRYWREAGIDIAAVKAGWYREIGQGMGPALNMAASDGAYVLSDRGTWLAFKNRAGLSILVAGDRRLFNQYGVILVNPAKHAHVKAVDGQVFIRWLLSVEGQERIGSYKIAGQQLFFPDAADPTPFEFNSDPYSKRPEAENSLR